MTPEKTDEERRQHKRYDIPSGAFALLMWNDRELLGSIKNISVSGLGISHIDENEDLDYRSRLKVNLISENKCHENFPGKNIWSSKEELGFSTARVKMKRRGIKLEGLSSANLLQLEEFIFSLVKE